MCRFPMALEKSYDLEMWGSHSHMAVGNQGQSAHLEGTQAPHHCPTVLTCPLLSNTQHYYFKLLQIYYYHHQAIVFVIITI
jgi:hypothetical protein